MVSATSRPLFLALLDQRTVVGMGRDGGTWAPVAWSRGWQTSVKGLFYQ